MKAEQAVEYSGNIIVAKQVTGSVCVRTGIGTFTLTDNRPCVIASNPEACKKALAGSNIRELIGSRMIALVVGG